MGPPPVPVIVLSGFLGAGKTTLLRALLSSGGVRAEAVGLIINDLAEVNVDARLVAEGCARVGDLASLAVAEELHGACVCCSGSSQLLGTIARLAGRRPSLEHIIVECSGMADPRSIARSITAELNKSSAPPFSLSSVVTVLDASSLADWIAAAPSMSPASSAPKPEPGFLEASHQQTISELYISQIESASVVVVHKVDRVSVAQVSSCIQFIRSLNPAAMVECARFGVLNPCAILSPTLKYADFMACQLAGQRIHPTSVEAPKATAEGADAAGTRCHAHSTGSACEDGCSHGHSSSSSSTSASNRSNAPAKAAPDTADPGTREAGQAGASAAPGAVRSFVLLAFRPFHPDRLQALIRRMRREMGGSGLPHGHALGDPWEGPRGAPSSGEEGEGGGKGQGSWEGGGAGAPSVAGGAAATPVLTGVLRSKGIVWVAPDMDLSREWAQCRGVFELQRGQPWLGTGVAREESGGACEGEGPLGASGGSVNAVGTQPGVGGDMHHGRRQEIVFIGTSSMDEAAIREQLTSCLLNDAEFAMGPDSWRQLFKDKIALTLSVAARTEANRQPVAHGSMCPCCDPQLREIMGRSVGLV